ADARETLAVLDQALAAVGRSRQDLGIEARLHFGGGQPDQWRAALDEWLAVGATHFSLNTMGCGFTRPDQHLSALRRFAETILPAYAQA
ncbi:MAG TPA: LLM class F420-dependent oxidoreductase, partial [Caldilineaceae bacterium]|nr:LLM class F420-dependent oxidoreductase [Caldilineaceae bacterium]